MTKTLPLFVALALSLAPAFAEAQQTAPNGPLKIVVIAGEGGVNIIQQKTAVSPIVEVRDRNDLPVAGATVTFAITGGKSAAFGGGAQTFTVTTNAAGRAAAAAINPLSNGAVQIQVSATFQGQTAAATIAQTNVMTASQAASAGSSGSSGGGVSATKIGLLVAAAGGAAYAVKSVTDKSGDDAPTAPAMSWMITTFANGASITPCTSPASTCEIRVSNNTGAFQIHVDMTGITAAENKLVFDCGGCEMISAGGGTQLTHSFAPPPAQQGYVPGIRFGSPGVFPLRVTWTSGGATVASFSILFTVTP